MGSIFLRSFLASLFSLSVIATLTACGGGGGGKSSPAPVTSHSSSSLSAPPSSQASSVSSGMTVSSISSLSSYMSSETGQGSSVSYTPVMIDAGADQYVTAGAKVNLQVATSGLSGEVSYQWQQLSGPPIHLSTSNQASTYFTAPAITETTDILLQVYADAETTRVYDTVRVVVNPEEAIKRYEAEDGILENLAIASAMAGFSGNGYVGGFTNDTGVVSWKVTTDSGNYQLRIGYHTSDGKGTELSINGQSTSVMLPASNGFTETIASRIFLDAGEQTISVGKGWGWYEIDYLELIPVPVTASPQTLDATPVNPSASPAAKRLFAYLHQQYGKVTLSGQQDLPGIETVFDVTGEKPAIYSFDLLNYSPLAVRAMGREPVNDTEDFIDVVNRNGHIASLLWHWHSPLHAKSTVNPCPTPNASCWWNSFYTEHSNFNLAAALSDPASAEYQALISDIDAIAIQLKKVQQADIPVLWRPLHEADGAWFWWGATGSGAFKVLWRLMYDRLTIHHDINNLLWVWTNEDPAWYPGDDVVDVIGIDAYPADKNDVLTGIWDKMFERFDGHKLIALTEFGGVPFIEEMQQQGVWWSYFASWTDGDELLGPGKMTDAELNSIYQSDAVITLDELPSFDE